MVRGLGIAGGLLLIGGLLAPALVARVAASRRLADTLSVNGVIAGGCMLAMSLWMLASSLWLKARVMRALLAMRAWRGDEAVLDVGCGRGLVTVGAARRLARGGTVRGIDPWQARDLSDNGPDQTLANAAAAGVADRVAIDTGDARALPYADASFDVVTSMTVVHNIPDAAGRDAAIGEMLRVLRPGGQLLLFDIRHVPRYARRLRALGAAEVRLRGPILLWGFLGFRLSATRAA